MVLFEWTLCLLFAAVFLARLADRLRVPYPVFLALGGAAISFLPGAPGFTLEPELALALFVAPVLLDAAFDTSLRDLKDNAAPVAGLVLAAVGLTTAAVAVVAHALVPSLPWAAAIALGAIVAPPDAAAATAVLRSLNPPHRVLLILEGESLLNDASALLIYRAAVAAAAGGFSLASAAPAFGLVLVGSLAAGALAYPAFSFVMRPIKDAPSAVILQFVGAFGVWILAERVGLSPILTVVAFAITAARRAPRRTPAAMRVPTYAVWDAMVFLLNTLAFVLVGLQIGPILERLSPAERASYGIVAAACLAVVVLVRFAWVMGDNTVVRLKNRWLGVSLPRPMLAPTARGGLIISWAGMRGIVTLAAAMALPGAFPYRDLIVFSAFTVVLGTLVLQGLTLRPLMLVLNPRDDGPVEREVRFARIETAKAALASLESDGSDVGESLKREFRLVLAGAKAASDGDGRSVSPRQDARLKALEAQRARLWDLRQGGVIGDHAYHRLEAEFDLVELESSP